ncbi:DUF6809 family protein [uncultured Oscillibacter sp.]|jgi:hypothetical protein|uniref:DUF6809 family protein n=1 Tax=uncultured Oscillibacter sp. TaxID=876091 RepID=UPI002614AA8E|nr:DUF6809 family protein [uncultured Oscillibacter sp.]
MRKILEDLYFGNIVPYEKRIAAGSELRHLVKRAADCEARLAEQLNDGEKQTLDTLISTQHKIDSTMAREYFILGFRLGVRLMTECMDEDDGELTDRG